jgi:hypothetical protein
VLCGLLRRPVSTVDSALLRSSDRRSRNFEYESQHPCAVHRSVGSENVAVCSRAIDIARELPNACCVDGTPCAAYWFTNRQSNLGRPIDNRIFTLILSHPRTASQCVRHVLIAATPEFRVSRAAPRAPGSPPSRLVTLANQISCWRRSQLQRQRASPVCRVTAYSWYRYRHAAIDMMRELDAM